MSNMIMDDIRSLSDEDLWFALNLANRALENAFQYGTQDEINQTKSQLEPFREEFRRRMGVFRVRA